LPENLGSIRVLEKCGMEYIGEEYIDGLLHKNYVAKVLSSNPETI
jgi:RimJ/RimL family protein N-acetyltransferase